MKALPSFEDEMQGVVTYELEGGGRVRLSAREVRKYGAAEILRGGGYGRFLPTERVPVMYQGQRVGSLPPDFDPLFVRSVSSFYEPRPGDFVRDGDMWVANKMLGPGDLKSVHGFVGDI